MGILLNTAFKVFLAYIRARNLPVYYEITFSLESVIILRH